MKHIVLAMLVLLVLFSACEKPATERIQLDFGYDFQPLQVGQYREYEVDSIVYVSDGLRADTARLFFREEIVEQRLSQAGDTIYVAERYERYQRGDAWQIREVFSMRRTPGQFIRTEGNRSFIKLVFPVRAGKRWDGHLFFDANLPITVASNTIAVFQNWDYRYREVNDETLEVQLADYEDNLNIRQATELYQRGIGLTERTWTVLSTQCGGSATLDCADDPWPVKAERGFVLRQKLIAHN